MPVDASSLSPPDITSRSRPGPLERLRRQLRGLGEFWWRERARRAQAAHCGAFIAVTGSCGKTTTTLLIERLLAAGGSSIAGGRNENHGRYLMKTIARLRRPVDYVVQEVSGHRPGAIADLTGPLRVDVAVVTVVGYDHNAAFGVSYSAAPAEIAAEKGKLVEALPPDGIACLNADDPLVAAMANRTTARVVTFGRSAGATLRAVNVGARWPSRLHFDLEVEGRVLPVATRFVGTIMLPNVLAALAVVYARGHDLDLAVSALAGVEPEPLHMSVVQGASGRTYVLDTYKAPFWSTALLAEDLANIGGRGTLFVLGEMSDLRNGNTRRYVSVMQRAAGLADRVILTGHAVCAQRRALRDGIANVSAAADIAGTARLIAAAPETLVILKAKKTVLLQEVMALVEGPQHDL
jgi:UDP-N-acetylmuramyl pentapeptide synthase